LLLIADDRSGSSLKGNQPVRMRQDQYQSLLQTFVEKGYTGQFAVRIIGNTPNSGFEEALTFEPTLKPMDINTSTTLSEKAKCRCINKKVEDTNVIIRNGNEARINNYIARVIRPKVIDYKPYGVDKTDVFTALRDIEMKMNLSSAFNKVIIVVFSDGIDSNKKELKLRIPAPADMILIGWASTKPVRDEKEIYLQSADDLVTWFKNLKL